MRITVDSTKCQGHNVCLNYLPDLLVPDDLGYVHVASVGGGEVPAGHEGAARTAADNCPEEALLVAAEEDARA